MGSAPILPPTSNGRFLTLFAGVFDPALVDRVWDIFFLEGWHVYFKVILILLKMDEVCLRLQRSDLQQAIQCMEWTLLSLHVLWDIFLTVFHS